MNCIEFTVLKAFTSEFKLRSHGSFENEALENEDWSTKHPKLENEAPYLENEAPKTRKRSTQISKTKHPKLENEAPKTRKRSTHKLENEDP